MVDSAVDNTNAHEEPATYQLTTMPATQPSMSFSLGDRCFTQRTVTSSGSFILASLSSDFEELLV